MKIKKCTTQHKASMITMPSSSAPQNQALKEALECGNLLLEQCIIGIKDTHVVARITIDKDNKYLGSITIEDLSQDEVNAFVNYVIQLLPRDIEWRCDLYSDKIHYQKLRKALCTSFDLDIHRESYTRKTEPMEISEFQFKKAVQMDCKELLHLMMRVSETTLDFSIQHDQTTLTPETAMNHMMNDFLNDPESDDLFQILYIDEEPVGFISVNRLLDTTGGIGYIGVDSIHQGHHYGSLLLKKAIDMSYHHNIHLLIGDIDEQNFAIRDNLLRCGFHEDCKQHMFLLKKH